MIISVSSLKNWFLNDTICDVLNISYNHFGFNKDSQTTNHFFRM